MRGQFVHRMILVSCIFQVGAFVTDGLSQSQRRRVAPQTETAPKTGKPAPAIPSPTVAPPATPETSPDPSPEPELQDLDTLKIATNLVAVPVVATNRDGNYIPDLRQEEFSISENGVKQEVAFFATVSAPFHVVLMLDTSGSTREKIGLIREAAISFVDQLQTADRVKVISFDDQVRELSEFTNNRAILRTAINKTTAGRGTKLYDAFRACARFSSAH